jgi:uncharacterized integral membrane protein
METTPPTPPPTAPQTKGNWWARNWKWFVPAGCLTVFVLFVAFIASILLLVFSAMKSSDVYKDALAKAQAEPAVIEALGTPIRDGMFASGSTHVDGASGDANLAIPVSGPKGKGTLYVVASKSAGHWNYSILALEVSATKERIDLLHDSR